MADEIPTLSTQRLVLRPLTAGDADAMVPVLADSRMYTFTGGRPPTLGELRARFRRLAGGVSPDGSQRWLNWIVRRHGDDAPIGAVQATVANDFRAADVAWEIGVAWQGHGFATESATAMIDWLIGEGVTEINALIHPDHAASAHVAERVGLAKTGEMIDGERRWTRVADPV